MSSNLGDVQDQQNPVLGSIFTDFATRYGLAQVPRTVPELLYALHPILTDHQIELLRYLFMDPKEFQQENNVFPPGQPEGLPQNMLYVLSGKNPDGSEINPATPATPASPGGAGTPATPAVPATPGNPEAQAAKATVVPKQVFSTTPQIPAKVEPGAPVDAAGQPLRAENPNPTNYNANVVQDPTTKLYYDKSFMSAPIDVTKVFDPATGTYKNR